jgi:hypothetical protein
METLIHADIFFFVATIGLVIILALIVIGLIQLIRLFRVLERISLRIEKKIDEVGDATKELVEDLRSNRIFSWLFGGRRRK